MKVTPRGRNEVGETLLEVLLALIILSLASVALITAFGTSINASSEHRSLANFDTVLASSISTTSTVVQEQYADVFSQCLSSSPNGGYPSQAALTAALGVAGYTAAIAPTGSQAAVEYSNDGSYSTSCSSGAGGDVGNPQLINVVVTDTATGISQNDTVVVDNPTVIQTVGVAGSSANSLIFTTQPEGATVNSPFSVQPILEVQDCTPPSMPGQPPTCSIVTSDLSPISSLTIASGPGGASLSNNCSSNETAGVATFSGCSLNVVGAGYTLFASEPDPSDPGSNLTATSAPFSVYAAQLDTPVIPQGDVVPASVLNAINVKFNGAPNAPGNQTYSVKACTDIAMSANCVIQQNFTSGSNVTGLMGGSTYYVEVTAAASQNFLGSTSPPGGPAMATVQLVWVPTSPIPTVTAGTLPGTLTVSFPAIYNPNPAGQTYTINACSTLTMGPPCVTNANFVTGGTVTMPYTPGTIGSKYYVEITANGSTGYLASVPSGQASQTVLSSVKAPTIVNASPSAATAGAITVAYSKPSGQGVLPSSYSVNVCTDAAMTQNCISMAYPNTGTPITGLTPGTTYYATVTGNSTTTGYASATSAVASAMATVALTQPTITTVGYGSVAGSVSIAGGSSNAQSGQTYTAMACKTPSMTGVTCVTNPAYVPGTDFTGLAYTAGTAGAPYYATLTANGITGYLGSSVSATSTAQPDTSEVAIPGSPTAVRGTVTQTISVTFAAATGTNLPSSYTIVACTNAGPPVTGCTTPITHAPGTFAIAGLTTGTTYYVQITGVSTITGFANSVSTVSAGAKAR